MHFNNDINIFIVTCSRFKAAEDEDEDALREAIADDEDEDASREAIADDEDEGASREACPNLYLINNVINILKIRLHTSPIVVATCLTLSSLHILQCFWYSAHDS